MRPSVTVAPMKRCSPRGWCVVMNMVLEHQQLTKGPGLKAGDVHEGHSIGVALWHDESGPPIDLSLCPWCGASLLPKPVVRKELVAVSSDDVCKCTHIRKNHYTTIRGGSRGCLVSLKASLCGCKKFSHAK